MVASHSRTFPLNSLSELELHHVEAEWVTYRAETGRNAGQVALWIGSGTETYLSTVIVK